MHVEVVGVDQGHTDIAIALSGGGVRAMAFHAGVLRFLAERGQMEAVSQVSSVSGGSLVAGIIFSRSGMKWPSSSLYLEKIHGEIRDILINNNLSTAANSRLFFRPSNWRYIFQRAKIVAQAIQQAWGINATLYDLPARPMWSLNGSSAETGRRFQFRYDEFGDYKTGYARAPDFPLAEAMASSAAFPGGIGPMPIDTKQYQWKRRAIWATDPATGEDVFLPSKLHIYDGGVYDNLGMEPIFDMGAGRPRGQYRVILSDAGAPLVEEKSYTSGIRFSSVIRLMDIMMNQTHALRIRAFINFLKRGGGGAYVGIGARPQKLFADCKVTPDASIPWLTEAEIVKVENYATTLSAMTPADFDLIEKQGYQSALANEAVYPYLK